MLFFLMRLLQKIYQSNCTGFSVMDKKKISFIMKISVIPLMIDYIRKCTFLKLFYSIE